MRDHYMAIETDPHRTMQEKYPYMVEWWVTSPINDFKVCLFECSWFLWQVFGCIVVHGLMFRWTKAHNLLLQCHLTQDTIKNIVQEAKIMLRLGHNLCISQLWIFAWNVLVEMYFEVILTCTWASTLSVLASQWGSNIIVRSCTIQWYLKNIAET